MPPLDPELLPALCAFIRFLVQHTNAPTEVIIVLVHEYLDTCLLAQQHPDMALGKELLREDPEQLDNLLTLAHNEALVAQRAGDLAVEPPHASVTIGFTFHHAPAEGVPLVIPPLARPWGDNIVHQRYLH